MRRDLIIDGMVFGTATLTGNDSTQNILTMFGSLKRNDVNCIMLDGLIISMYNITRGEEIREKTGVPVIAITFKDSEGLEGTIRRHFPNDWKLKLEQYRKLGQTINEKRMGAIRTSMTAIFGLGPKIWLLLPPQSARLLLSNKS